MYQLEDYYALKAAIAQGASSVNYGDKSASYRSLAEMKEILRMMEEDLFPDRVPRRRRLAVVDRGYFSNKKR